jgi:hypothetical protein
LTKNILPHLSHSIWPANISQEANLRLRQIRQHPNRPYIRPVGESPGGLFIGAVRGSCNNVRTDPLTASFTQRTQSYRHYNHFIPITTLYMAYYMVTHVLTCHGLYPMMSLGPLISDRFSMKIAKDSTWSSVGVATQDLYQECRSHPPV